MTLLELLLVLACVVTETAQQMLYRLASRSRRRYWFYVTPAVAVFGLEMICWLMLLKLLPLGVALPLKATSYAAIPLAARVIFSEPVNRRQWGAIALIVAGVVLVTMNQT